METQKIVNFLNDLSNKEPKFVTKNGMLQKVKQQKFNTAKTILLNVKQKVLNQVFVIVLMHLFQLQEIYQELQTMMQMLHLKLVHHFVHVRQKLMM